MDEDGGTGPRRPAEDARPGRQGGRPGRRRTSWPSRRPSRPPTAARQPDGAGAGRLGPAAGPRPARRERAAAGDRPGRVRRRRLPRRRLRAGPEADGRLRRRRGGRVPGPAAGDAGLPRAARSTLLDAAAAPSPPAPSPSSSPRSKEEADGAARARTRRTGRWPTLRAVGRAVARGRQGGRGVQGGGAALGLGPGSPGSNDPKAIAALFRRVRQQPDACGGSASWPAATAGWRSRSSGRRPPTAWTTWSASCWAATSAGCCRTSWRSWPTPSWADDACGGWSSARLMCREYHAVEPVGRGPIDRLRATRAGRWRARRSTRPRRWPWPWPGSPGAERWCALVAYCGDSGERLLALPPGRWDEAALVDWLEAFIGRGSTSTCRSARCPDLPRAEGARRARPTCIFLTDARSRRDPAELQRRSSPGRGRCRPGSSPWSSAPSPATWPPISDEVYTVARALGEREDAVGRVLSV